MIKHLTTRPISPHRNPLLPIKRIFGYFFCNRKKSLASATSAGGETAFEVEVEFDLKPPHPAQCPRHGEPNRPRDQKSNF